MPSGLPVDPIRDLKGGAIAQLTEPVLIDETRTIDETRHDEIGCNRRHPAGGSPPSPQSVSASNLEGRTRTLTMWVLYECGQVHAGVAQMVTGCIGGAQGMRTVRGTRSR